MKDTLTRDEAKREFGEFLAAELNPSLYPCVLRYGEKKRREGQEKEPDEQEGLLRDPDYEQCQAQKPGSPLSFGGRVKPVRCENTPTVIAVEIEPGEDGLRGAMSLCPGCKQVLERQQPGRAAYRAIDPDGGA